eukprot:UN09626
MLQFTSVFHSVKGDNEPSDRQYIPSVDVILNNIDTIQNILLDNKVSIMAIGIEMSYGHTPKDIQQWLDCQVSIALYNALQNESQFVRFQTFEKDKQILNHKCIDELIYLFEKYKIIILYTFSIRINNFKCMDLPRTSDQIKQKHVPADTTIDQILIVVIGFQLLELVDKKGEHRVHMNLYEYFI